MRIIKTSLLLSMILMVQACGNNQSTQRPASDAGLKTASETNVQLAVGYIKRQQYDVAKQKLDKAIEQDQTNIEAYKMMAYLMSGIGKYEEAEDYYQQALDFDADDPETHNSYGAFLCNQGRIDEALSEFKLAYDNPYYETAYLAYGNAGTCLIEQKQYAKAEVFLRRALQKQPRMPSVLLSMAEVGIHTNKYLMSRAYIQRFHDVSKPTAESLWIQMQAEKALGAHNYYVKAAQQLLKDFPDSAEARRIDQSVRNERVR